ncbi:hypothetical protein U2084_14940, partial [Listeria monocytogenes]|uniref:hypothetical protein n=1 Tax=Listeria monocytogenes TaxID=1639 RepID=UPI002FDB9919
WVVDTTKIIPYTDTLATYGIATKAFLNSNYLPLSGGTLTGALTGTSASFSNTVDLGYNNNLIFGGSPYRFKINRSSAGQLPVYFDD